MPRYKLSPFKAPGKTMHQYNFATWCAIMHIYFHWTAKQFFFISYMQYLLQLQSRISLQLNELE